MKARQSSARRCADLSTTVWCSLKNNAQFDPIGVKTQNNVQKTKRFNVPMRCHYGVRVHNILAGAYVFWAQSFEATTGLSACKMWRKKTVQAFLFLHLDVLNETTLSSLCHPTYLPAFSSHQVHRLFATHGAFAALTTDGTVRCWGDPFAGGDVAEAQRGRRLVVMPGAPNVASDRSQ